MLARACDWLVRGCVSARTLVLKFGTSALKSNRYQRKKSWHVCRLRNHVTSMTFNLCCRGSSLRLYARANTEGVIEGNI